MKSILLASVSVVGFAGMAAAEVTWAADAEFGYNEEIEDGFYFAGGLGVVASAELDYGLEAGIAMDVDLGFTENEDSDTFGGSFSNISVDASDFVVFLQTTEDNGGMYSAGLYVGDTETASQQIWSGTTNMETDNFLEVGDVDDGADDGDFVDGVFRGDLGFGNVEMSVSYFLADSGNMDDDVDALEGMQIGARTTFGAYTVGAMYQEEVMDDLVNGVDADPGDDGITGTDDDIMEEIGSIDELFGVYASTTAYGADITVAYSDNLTTDASSLGFEVGYTVGPVVATVFYSLEEGAGGDDDAVDDNYGVQVAYASGAISVLGYYHDGNDEELGLEGSYSFDALTVYAGYIDNRDDIEDNTEYYVAAEYGLSDAATAFAAYGDTGDGYDGDLDAIGNAYEVNDGTTVGISFTF